MQDLQIDFHPPDDILGWTKAFLDSGAAVMFIVVSFYGIQPVLLIYVFWAKPFILYFPEGF